MTPEEWDKFPPYFLTGYIPDFNPYTNTCSEICLNTKRISAGLEWATQTHHCWLFVDMDSDQEMHFSAMVKNESTSKYWEIKDLSWGAALGIIMQALNGHDPAEIPDTVSAERDV